MPPHGGPDSQPAPSLPQRTDIFPQLQLLCLALVQTGKPGVGPFDFDIGLGKFGQARQDIIGEGLLALGQLQQAGIVQLELS